MNDPSSEGSFPSPQTGIQAMQRPMRAVALLLALTGFAGLSACEEQPFGFVEWTLSPDTARIFSLARPELNLPSGFDFVDQVPVKIEGQAAIGGWDMALDTRNGALVAVPAVAFGLDSEARIADMGQRAFDDIDRAPTDTLRYTGMELPLQVGNLYVVRTRITSGFFGQSCFLFAKFSPLALDTGEGTLDFQFDGNPNCNDRRLKPDA